MTFIHLHTHSDASIQDGAQSCKQIAERASELGMESVALTDHGRAGGLLEFKKECEKAGVRPIYGYEAYVAPESRFTKSKIEGHKTSYHLTILAKNEEGLKNIFRLTSAGFTEGFYYKPRIDMELLKKHSEGLVVLSGCGSGRTSVMFLQDKEEEAVKYTKELHEIFKDDFYIEVQNHGLDWQLPLKKFLFELAEKLNIPIVATQDSHYPMRVDAALHGKICKLTAGDLSFDSDHSWFKSTHEIKRMFEPDEYHAIDNTALVADKCRCDWKYDKTIWPVYDLPEGQTPEQELADLTWAGFKKKFGAGTKEYIDRVNYELDMIKQMGFPTYFLIVQDFINWAKEQKIAVGPGRGSGAGSLVCYCIGITNVDPIKYGLYFERFLNPARVSNPDLDIDFCKKRRTEVIEYVSEKYGADKVAHIGTVSKFKPRGSLKAFARVCGYDTSVGIKLAGMVPPDISGKQIKFDELVKLVPEIMQTEYPDAVNFARKAEGLKNQVGVHAAGVVISDKPLTDYLPLFTGKGNEVTTQFDMNEVEDIGLVKNDFLGLRNLTVINETCKLIKETQGIDIDIDSVEDGDEKVYNEIFQQGRLEGVFQFENSGGFKDLCMQVTPKSISDLAAITALFRPGPLGTKDSDGKSMVDNYVKGRSTGKVNYLLPELEPIIHDTYGVMTFQEQIMKICTDLAGYTLPEADNMRKIIGKKLPEKMKLEKEKFVGGCVLNGVSESMAEELFGNIEGFAAYSFNKSHSVAYSFLSYQNAWLKTYYPDEFYTALLNCNMDDQNTMVKYIHAAREDGVSIAPPDVNRSGAEFTLSQGTILFGLAGVKGVGAKAVENIVRAREEKEFTSLTDLIEAKVNKGVLGALAECGALEEITDLSRDSIRDHAATLITYLKKSKAWDERLERFEQREKDIKKAVAAGKKPPRHLTKLPPRPECEELVPGEPLTRAERLRLERDTLGFYLTGHPLDDYPGLLRMARYTLSDIYEGKTGPKEYITIPAVISLIKKKRTRKDKNYGTLIIEDCTGRMEVTIFPSTWTKIADNLEEGVVSVLKGRVLKEIPLKDDSPPIIKMSISHVRKIEGDISTKKIENLSMSLKDGTLVTFMPSENQNVNDWQRVGNYIKNIKRTG